MENENKLSPDDIDVLKNLFTPEMIFLIAGIGDEIEKGNNFAMSEELFNEIFDFVNGHDKKIVLYILTFVICKLLSPVDQYKLTVN